MAGNGEKKDKGGGGPTVASFSGLIFSHPGLTTFKTVCSECKTEMDCDTKCMNACIGCGYCWGTFLATKKASPPNDNSFINQSSSTSDNPLDYGNKSSSCSGTPQILEQQKLAAGLTLTGFDHPPSSSPKARSPGVIGEHRSRKAQPSSPNLDSALVHNNQLWSGSRNAFNFKLPWEDHPSRSSGREHPMPGMIQETSRQVQPPSRNLYSEVVKRQIPINYKAGKDPASNPLLKDKKVTPVQSTNSSNQSSTQSEDKQNNSQVARDHSKHS